MPAMRLTAGYKALAEQGRANETCATSAAPNVGFPAVLGAAADPEKTEPTGGRASPPDPRDGRDQGQSTKPIDEAVR